MLARVIQLKNIKTDTFELAIPNRLRVIPFRNSVDLELIRLEDTTPIESDILPGSYNITFINRKGISQPLPIQIAGTDNRLSWITGYEPLKWQYPGVHVFEWLTTDAKNEPKTPRGISIFLDRQKCLGPVCRDEDRRITVVRNTQNDGSYEWNGVDERGVFIQDGIYKMIIADANDPDIQIISDGNLTISTQRLQSR